MIRMFTFALVLAVGCGGKKSAPATSSTAPAETGGSGGHQEMAHHEDMEHAEMPAEMSKFHDVLAPRWHADKGAKRMKDTCAALPEFHANADALAKATPPTKANADTWTAGTRALVDAVGGLDAPCKANDGAKFEAAFTKVHESFHGLMAAAGMHGEEGKEGEHKM
jgi:hypothetical protein